ncbi:MAG: PadR family transcriptional regulator [Edaphobacter sp.]|uniref:PadR family transcriptional regulator n=1 Tax=Edaphobacter sp. TaxID=1934404 RepID=UPI00238CA839|nr:PadR family transcriptional regulator [Edaphobacter sp.]MDE1177746.1 PadR family transcriptional regulator [Edaphobacter sp.]
MKSKKTQHAGSTANALLGLLTLGDMSGYDMRSLIDRSIGHFWTESYGQIYPSLKWLSSEGFVEKKTERKKGRPDRNVFTLTPAGRKRLKQWLAVPPVVPEIPRSELLLKLFFGLHVPQKVSRSHLASFLQFHEDALTRYTELEAKLQREETGDPQLPYWLMTLSFGRHRSEASVNWAKQSMVRLDDLEKNQGPRKRVVGRKK